MHSFLKEQKSFGETRCRKSCNQFEEYDSPSPRHVKRVSGKERTTVGKDKSRSSSAKSPRSKIRGSAPRRDWTTTAMCPKQGLGSCQKYVQAQGKRQGCIVPSRGGEASTKEPEEREFVVDSGASTLTVSEKDLNSAELETMRTSRSPTTVMTPNGEVQTREEATVCVKNWTCSSKLCFLKKLPQLFPWRNSVGIMGIHTTGSVVKNLISSEMAKELIAIYRTVYHF